MVECNFDSYLILYLFEPLKKILKWNSFIPKFKHMVKTKVSKYLYMKSSTCD
jgi:hypothetical protein